MRKRKLYMGCALATAPSLYVAEVRELRRKLKKHFTVLEFQFPHPGTDEDVYVLDIKEHVANCHLMLALLDYPSTGLGYELATATERHGKPVLCLSHMASKPSRLIVGINRRSFEFNRYNSFVEIEKLLLNFEKRKFKPRKKKV